jgi:TIR domain
MYDVFISYSNRDREIVDRIAGDLAQHGVKIFYDRELVPGEAWAPRLAHEIKSAKNVLVILSPAYVKSAWAQKELEAATLSEAEGNTRIIPVLVEDTEIPPFLRSKHYADLRENYKGGLELIQKALTAQPETSEESKWRTSRRIIDLLGVMVSLLGAAGSVVVTLASEKAVRAAPSVLAVVGTVMALTVLIGVMSGYRLRRRSASVELVAHAVESAYIDALDDNALNPLRVRETRRG